ncbi:MAG TPA: DUF2085 domain-containing protein [Roseiflexaceae bacterium]|nr:DUF2085 domain-containing protein [Roseiflexaceae bacterium]HMP39963.1 DUF2085 domain-containing protein [Roseiflexaceae bacterium]
MSHTANGSGWLAIFERGVRWGLRHWLRVVNLLLLVYAGLPWLSPLAFAAGYPLLGRILFWIYTPLCHQISDRSFFVYGYQVAFCHRDVALYTTLLAGGLAFGFVRERLQPIPFWAGGLLTIPILLDGGSHMLEDVIQLGLRSGGNDIGTPNFWLRIITGILFGLAVVLTAYPRLDRDLRRSSFNGAAAL